MAASGLRSQPEIERIFNRYIFPRWQHRPFRELKRSDVTALLDQIEDEHGPRQADMVLAIVSKLSHWYEARNDDYTSPIVRGMRREKNGARSRTLDDHACDTLGTFGGMIRLLLLTAQRLRKVAGMQWTDVSDGVWTMRKEHDREKSHAGTLMLPTMAVAIIDAQPRVHENPYVFPAAHGHGPFNAFSQRKGELDALLPKSMPPWVLHDLRRPRVP